jgi:hypothetical protein
VAVLLLVIGWLAAPAPAAADVAREAAAAYARGQKLFKEHKFVGAIATFERAYELKPHFYVQCIIARCYQNLNNMVKSAAHYRRCLDEGAARDAMAQRVTTSMKAVQAQITWVKVVSPGRGGTIHLDGVAMGEAPRRIAINPGRHVIEVRREGARPASAKLNTVGGEEREISLVPTDPNPAQTLVPDEVEQDEPVVTDRPSRRGLSQVWFWSAVGLTAALAVATAILGAQTAGLRSDFDDDPTQAIADEFYARRRLTNVFLGLAAAAAASGTVLYFFTDFGGSDGGRGDAERALLVGAGLRGSF